MAEENQLVLIEEYARSRLLSLPTTQWYVFDAYMFRVSETGKSKTHIIMVLAPSQYGSPPKQSQSGASQCLLLVMFCV